MISQVLGVGISEFSTRYAKQRDTCVYVSLETTKNTFADKSDLIYVLRELNCSVALWWPLKHKEKKKHSKHYRDVLTNAAVSLSNCNRINTASAIV